MKGSPRFTPILYNEIFLPNQNFAYKKATCPKRNVALQTHGLRGGSPQPGSPRKDKLGSSSTQLGTGTVTQKPIKASKPHQMPASTPSGRRWRRNLSTRARTLSCRCAAGALFFCSKNIPILMILSVTHKPPFCNAQFSVKHTQNIDCGGGYIKLLPTSRCAVKGLMASVPIL